VKTDIQFTQEYAVAFFIVTGWSLFWLFAFQPAAALQSPSVNHPEVVRLIADDDTLKKLAAPTLFALPSIEGFSGRFVEDRVIAPKTVVKPANPIRYLPRAPLTSSRIDTKLLAAETLLPVQDLPLPDSTSRNPPLPERLSQIFPSPEVQARVGVFPEWLDLPGELPETLRVYVQIRPDGTVEHAFCDTPVTNAALLQAIRALAFKPSMNHSDGWIDLRFKQGETR